MKFITLKNSFIEKEEKFNIKVTQEWTQHKSRSGGVGHYKGYIEDEKGNIVQIIGTTCGPPTEKITQHKLREIFVDFVRNDLKYIKEGLREE